MHLARDVSVWAILLANNFIYALWDVVAREVFNVNMDVLPPTVFICIRNTFAALVAFIIAALFEGPVPWLEKQKSEKKTNCCSRKLI